MRRRSCSSASARRPSRIPELLPKLSRYVMGERVCWPEETAPRRPASCLDLPTWRGACRLRCHRLRRRRRRGAAGTASRAASLTQSARPGRRGAERLLRPPRLAARGSVRREASRRAADSGLGSVSCLVTRAAGVKGYGGGSLDQGDGSNRVPAASGGAPACGGGRGRDGQVDGGWTVFVVSGLVSGDLFLWHNGRIMQ